MPVTLTIKQVPDAIADGLRQRAAANRRSLQRELLLIVERAASGDGPLIGAGVSSRIAEPPAPAYNSRKAADKTDQSMRTTVAERSAGKLSLDALWQRARKLGAPMPSESAAIVRRDRDARHRR
jgi:hypothetical protein